MRISLRQINIDSAMDKSDRLREKVVRIEEKIKFIADPRHRGGYDWSLCPEQRDKVRMLAQDRAACLDRMFLATPDEVRRFERLNELLIRKADEMRQRSAMLYDSLLGMRKMESFDDWYEVEGRLRVEGDSDCQDGILKLPEDAYYGSDFLFMSGILRELIPQGMSQSFCGRVLKAEELGTEKENPGDSFTHSLEDGTSWAEESLRHPALSHICICHPIHDICTHHPYSIPDMLRINDFSTEVTLTVSNRFSQG